MYPNQNPYEGLYQSQHQAHQQPQVYLCDRDKTTAALLAIFLGGLGAHKFYLGEIGPGVLYVLFCWTGVPALVGLIEGIVLANMAKEKFHAKHVVWTPR